MTTKITGLEIRQLFAEGTPPQRVLNRIISDFAQTQEDREDLYDAIIEYSRATQKQVLAKQVKHLENELTWL